MRRLAMNSGQCVVSHTPAARHETSLAADRRFLLYKPEKGQIVRRQDIIENKALKQLALAWKEYLIGLNSVPLPNTYDKALDLVKDLKFSAADIQKFVIGLTLFQELDRFPAKAGVFLSALINSCTDREFLINVRHLSVPLFCFGYRNTKIVTVEGNLIGEVGYYMKSGTIIVNGDVLGGRDIHPTTHIGACMEGGKIVINGNSHGNGIGASMRDGEIHLNGDHMHVASNIFGGSVYHKGKLISHSGRYDY